MTLGGSPAESGACRRANAGRFGRFLGRENGTMTAPGQCLACGGPLPPYGGRGRPRRYCSDACRWRHGHEVAADRRAAAGPMTHEQLIGYLRGLAGPG
jgi:hypothetical protein